MYIHQNEDFDGTGPTELQREAIATICDLLKENFDGAVLIVRYLDKPEFEIGEEDEQEEGREAYVLSKKHAVRQKHED